DLITTYQAIVDDLGGIARHLRRYKQAHCDEHYYATRTQWNTRRHVWSAAKRAATFIYLNKTCFNGLWRVNRAGHFNVPVGRYTNPTIYMPEALRAAREVLARTELRAADYRAVIADAEAGDLVYLDPPYQPLSATASFTSYTAGAFDENEQRALAEAARGLAARGCHVVVSNSNAALIRPLYQGFRIDRVRCSRSINSVGSGRGEIDELIITRSHACPP
ncbi:MAG TPA: Dam family site-specific DNA-(adenine-N6)-methyltransferase, partial [Kofleriaceae bacterium]